MADAPFVNRLPPYGGGRGERPSFFYGRKKEFSLRQN